MLYCAQYWVIQYESKKGVMKCEQNNVACNGRRNKRRMAGARYTGIMAGTGERRKGKFKRTILRYEMRKIYQMDCKGGMLSIGERTEPDQVALCLHTEGKEMQVLLSREQWMELCRMDYTIVFAPVETEQTQAQLSVVTNG